MAFQFKRDRGENITLVLAGDIDLEVTPEIKAQIASQSEDAASLTIDATNISYLDSSGVSILIIAMQTCKQKKISFNISSISEEAVRVLRLAKLDKILPIASVSGPADLIDVDVFSKTGDGDTAIATEISHPSGGAMNEPEEPAMATPSADDDLIAAIASGDMSPGGSVANEQGAPAIEAAPEPEPEAEPVPEPVPEAEPKAASTSTSTSTSAPTPPTPDDDSQNGPSGSSGSGGSGGFTPGTFG